MPDFSLLVLEGTYATSVAATLNMLAAARELAPRLGVAPPTWQLFSVHGGSVALQSGMQVDTARMPRRPSGDGSTWIVPGLGLDSAQAVQQRLVMDDARCACSALRAHVRAGGAVAAACSGVFLLQAAGLLQGRHATTAWWLAAELARLEPACQVDADRIVCVDGAVVTAGAAFAHADLVLHLLRTRCGHALADRVARVLLLDGRRAHAPAPVPEAFANGDELVCRLAARLEAALPQLPRVSALAHEFCMSERTLARHVKRVTGGSTLALLQDVRQRRARALLESSRLTVDQVAVAVGYQDATALRRLMHRVAGASPGRFRPAAVHGRTACAPIG